MIGRGVENTKKNCSEGNKDGLFWLFLMIPILIIVAIFFPAFKNDTTECFIMMEHVDGSKSTYVLPRKDFKVYDDCVRIRSEGIELRIYTYNLKFIGVMPVKKGDRQE